MLDESLGLRTAPVATTLTTTVTAAAFASKPANAAVATGFSTTHSALCHLHAVVYAGQSV